MPDMPKAKASRHPLTNKRAFQNALVRWFNQEGKNYPWRETTDPWAILVSEIMLQQTQIGTVLGKGHYRRFMALYPTPALMAKASEQEVLKAWEGLGYYRRARNLHAAAKAITEQHHGQFPEEYSLIRALPGIGDYTAGAVSSFAYNQAQAIVDANVSRVFSRLFDYQHRVDTTAGSKQLWQWAAELVSPGNPRSYNSALMELGQSCCSNKSPDCINCPVKSFCQCSAPGQLPQKKSATKITRVEEFALFSQDAHGRVMLQQQAPGSRREGMWTLPQRTQQEIADLAMVHQSNYAITRYHVTLKVYTDTSAHSPMRDNEQWHGLDQLEHLPMPSPYRKALEWLLSETAQS